MKMLTAVFLPDSYRHDMVLEEGDNRQSSAPRIGLGTSEVEIASQITNSDTTSIEVDEIIKKIVTCLKFKS